METELFLGFNLYAWITIVTVLGMFTTLLFMFVVMFVASILIENRNMRFTGPKSIFLVGLHSE